MKRLLKGGLVISGKNRTYADVLMDGEKITKVEADAKTKEYASTYSAMKPKQAAGIMEQMTDNLQLVANILQNMTAAQRGSILGAMDSKVAASVTKLMEP